MGVTGAICSFCLFIPGIPGALVEASVAGLPGVTIGGQAATGVSVVSDGEIAFSTPALKAGSSITGLISYADGEQVLLPVSLAAVSTPAPNADVDVDGLPDLWELTYGLDPNMAADASRRAGERADARPGARAAAPSHRHRDPLPRRGRHQHAVPHAHRARQSRRPAGDRTPPLREESMARCRRRRSSCPRCGAPRWMSKRCRAWARRSSRPRSNQTSPLIVDRTLSWGGADGLRRARRNRRRRAGAHVVSRRGRDAQRLQPVLPPAESECGRGPGARALPAAERRAAREDLHAAAELAQQHLGERGGLPGPGQGAGRDRCVGRVRVHSTTSPSSSSAPCTWICQDRCSGRGTRARA